MREIFCKTKGKYKLNWHINFNKIQIFIQYKK